MWDFYMYYVHVAIQQYFRLSLCETKSYSPCLTRLSARAVQNASNVYCSAVLLHVHCTYQLKVHAYAKCAQGMCSLEL